jgi:hypothetical protein
MRGCWVAAAGILGFGIGAVIVPIVIIAVLLAVVPDTRATPGEERVGFLVMPCMALVLGPLGAVVGVLVGRHLTRSRGQNPSDTFVARSILGLDDVEKPRQ